MFIFVGIMHAHKKQSLYNYLSAFVQKERLDLFDKVLNYRTRHITVVIEDVFQSHNANAVVRSCECFGIQDIYTIEDRNEFAIASNISHGATKWIDIHSYTGHVNNTLQCIKDLKQKNYKIVATTPHTDDCMIEDVDISMPLALVFGTEKQGISDEVKAHADMFVRIPIYGFTESYNISVAAAISLHHLTYKLHRSLDIDWMFSSKDRLEKKIDWILRTIPYPEIHLAHFEKKYV